MQIFINLYFLVIGLNVGVRYVPPSNTVDPNPQPTLIEDVPEEQFHVEEATLFAGSGRGSGRTFNSNIVRIIPDTDYHRFFQFNILGTSLRSSYKFIFERDEYRRILNVIKLHGNKRPARGIDNLQTYVASIKGIQFLVHKTRFGTLVGASPPPPNQLAKSKVKDHKPKIEPKKPEPREKRLKI